MQPLRAVPIRGALEKTRAESVMDAKANLKAKLPSRHVTEGPERAPQRSYYYAMGLTRE